MNEIFQLLLEHFGNIRKVTEWIYTKNPLLGDVMPFELYLSNPNKLLQFIKTQLAENKYEEKN